jgi:hypothetical protein
MVDLLVNARRASVAMRMGEHQHARTPECTQSLALTRTGHIM